VVCRIDRGAFDTGKEYDEDRTPSGALDKPREYSDGLLGRSGGSLRRTSAIRGLAAGWLVWVRSAEAPTSAVLGRLDRRRTPLDMAPRINHYSKNGVKETPITPVAKYRHLHIRRRLPVDTVKGVGSASREAAT
jgi:hypothetical protein